MFALVEKFKTDTKISQCNGTPLDRELEVLCLDRLMVVCCVY